MNHKDLLDDPKKKKKKGSVSLKKMGNSKNLIFLKDPLMEDRPSKNLTVYPTSTSVKKA